MGRVLKCFFNKPLIEVYYFYNKVYKSYVYCLISFHQVVNTQSMRPLLALLCLLVGSLSPQIITILTSNTID